MKKYIIILLMLLSITEMAQSPQGKKFGFGIILGDPTGGTLKYWTTNQNALVFDIGGSYFGSPRIGVDYLWHFDAFNSNIVKMYAGPGAALGIGEGRRIWYRNKGGDEFYIRSSGESALALRGVFGINVVPRATPLEMFLDIGVLFGISPGFGTAVDAAIGIRFYP
ncbi:MAG TPA: hypothetical protein VFF33_14540 [Ignavibacteriaceae bacterium]|nr:hypothetical protein [Ignavibacteriaceae bacterium]